MVVDCKCVIINNRNLYLSRKRKESLIVLRHLEKQILSGVSIKRVVLDKEYDTGAVHRSLELLGITRFILRIQFPNSPEKCGFFYNQQRDYFISTKGQQLIYHRLNCNKPTGKHLRCYYVSRNSCLEGDRQVNCFERREVHKRILASSCYLAFFKGHQLIKEVFQW